MGFSQIQTLLTDPGRRPLVVKRKCTTYITSALFAHTVHPYSRLTFFFYKNSHTPYAAGGVPRDAALNARAGTLLAKAGPTEQYPLLFNQVLDATETGKALYGEAYRAHPSKFARWNENAFCAGAFDASGNADPDFANFDACFPRVVPQIGLTHDLFGKRLLTNQGQPLPTGYDDPNDMGVGEAVTG